jgi:hypothetical protein
MLRAATLTLLAVSLAIPFAQAQHGVAGFHGSSGGFSGHSGFQGHHLARGFEGRGTFSSFRHRNNGFVYPYWWPYDYPYDDGADYEQPYMQVVEREPAPAAVAAAPPPPPTKAQVIEIPVPANSVSAKPQPPAIFILANGDRLEASRFVLTSNNLSINVNRRQRTIPVDQLDLDATIAANHERGIELRVPADHNEISLSF